MVAVTSSGTAVVTLPTDTQILITREFAAPKHLVYKAHTIPELIKRWWSGKRGEVTIAEVDLRVGGTWRYVMVTGDGFEVAFHGEYREIVPNERIVSTEVYEGAPETDGDVVCTYTFTENDGRTTLTLLADHPNKEVRDIVINSGMEAGMQEGMDLLEQVAISLRLSPR
ncbi:MAG: SRPBCC family protein [Actinomycetota bacterium]